MNIWAVVAIGLSCFVIGWKAYEFLDLSFFKSDNGNDKRNDGNQ